MLGPEVDRQRGNKLDTILVGYDWVNLDYARGQVTSWDIDAVDELSNLACVRRVLVDCKEESAGVSSGERCTDEGDIESTLRSQSDGRLCETAL